ncbi:MAG TPA: hypothetical protein VGA49_03220 [Patescibacteria group bacterium]
MDCNSAREIYYFIQSGESKKIDQAKRAEATGHIQSCPECQALFPEYAEEENGD